MSCIRLVIFDVAGTIVEDHGEIVRAFAIALKDNNIDASEDELLRWKGASKREVIRHFVQRQHGPRTDAAEDVVERTYNAFCDVLETQYEIIPVKGAAETFRWLQARGVQICTTTGFYRDMYDVIVAKVGWKYLFQSSVCSDDVTCGRPAPYMIFRAMEAARVMNVSEVMNVGDTPLDLQAAANAGVRANVGVLTGIYGAERLSREKPTHILSSIAELPVLIEQEYMLPQQLPEEDNTAIV